MEWKHPPLHRHLATIGIGSVFISPPPHSLPTEPVQILTKTAQHDNGSDTSNFPSNEDHDVIDTWEIVGDIKSSPGDFLVREIGWAPPLHSSDTDAAVDSSEPASLNNGTSKYRRLPGWSRRVAGLCETPDSISVDQQKLETAENSTKGCISELSTAKKFRSTLGANEMLNSTFRSTSNKDHNQSVQDSSTTVPSDETEINQQSQSNNVRNREEPLDGLGRILKLCNVIDDTERQQSAQEEVAANDTLQQLADLQNSTNIMLSSSSTADAIDSSIDANPVHKNNDCVWIQTSRIAQPSDHLNNWKLLHQYIRLAYPLLRTEASSVGPIDQSVGKEPVEKSWVKVSIDKSFFSIAPLLAKPSEDLLALYKFRNFGPIAASNGGTERNRAKYNKNHNRGGRSTTRKDEGLSSEKQTHQSVLLRLQPDLPRNERRIIHQALTSTCRRDFDTSTSNDVPLNEDETTTAIVVQWSRSAIQGSQKKRKRNDGDQTKSDISAVFCVLRKDQCEHQVAINKISRALKCRVGDIGLAGIKDMQAVTYQFCTIRNVDVKRVQRVNELLGHRVQLSDYVMVQGIGVLLDRGRLLGNRFELILRNMKRVQRKQVVNGASWKERYVPVKASHIDTMVRRISEHGFINFYGEQRVGDAGFANHVGVRSFDVGRAMLKNDFSLAIDLIMAGRSEQVYSPSAEEVEAREVWRKTKDARQTLAKFPKNTSTMTRERDLIKGVLRYGNALDAIRCVHHSVRMFWIHAYQSFVWNKVASERVKRFGLSPIIGDLFDASDNSINDGTAVEVKVVTDPSTVDISQIVLPLPGYNIQYPTNDIGELYQKILSDDGIKISKDSVPEATAKGSYRKLIQKAHDLKWEKLVGDAVSVNNGTDDSIVADVKITFELESGSYATMMLRELMVTTMAR